MESKEKQTFECRPLRAPRKQKKKS